jgi:hypothetical protein
MFDQRPDARLMPLSMLRNGRTKSWIITVPNGAFLEELCTLYPAERPACIVPNRRPDASPNRFNMRTTCEMILAFLLAGSAIAAGYIFWP